MGILRVERRPGVLGWDVEAVSRESSQGASEKRKRTFPHPDIILPDEYPDVLWLRESSF